MRTGWVIVIAVGLLAAVVRLAGPAPLADLTGAGYLLAATLVFERWRRTEPVRVPVASGSPPSLQP